MTARPTNKLETHFEEYGTLPKLRPVGRIIRLALGAWLLHFLYQLIRSGSDVFIGTAAPNHWTIWLAAAIGFLVTPYVVNIGWSRNWRHHPRTAVVAIAAMLVIVDLLVYGTWWAPPLGVFAWLWFIYWVGHLGLSFVLSALIATPGCEMRAIPHLWTLASGVRTREHYCPGFLDRLDRWERRRHS